MCKRLPAWFLAHGAPLHLLGDQPVQDFWRKLPEYLPQAPKAILCLSAHWLTPEPCLAGDTCEPGIQYDFFGFPDKLYQIQWPLRGDAEIAHWLKSRLNQQLGKVEYRDEQAFDHGLWVPLINAWPQPDFPLYQLSLCPQKGAHWHLELGQKLAGLRDEGVLVIGSGGLVHNLGKLDWQAKRGEAVSWAAEFMQALEQAIKTRDYKALCNPWSLPFGKSCVPTIEHYLPLLVMLGCGMDEAITALYREWEYGSLALHSYALGAEQ